MTARIGTLQGVRRKVVHATLYEAIAVSVVTAAVMLFTNKGLAHAGSLALATSVAAVSWNMVFNSLFEAWERRQADRARTLRRRIAHAIGFEGGLILLTVPLIAWWLDMSWWAAFVADLGLVAFFLVYTFCFNWGFDHVFGLPDSARPANG